MMRIYVIFKVLMHVYDEYYYGVQERHIRSSNRMCVKMKDLFYNDDEYCYGDAGDAQ